MARSDPLRDGDDPGNQGDDPDECVPDHEHGESDSENAALFAPAEPTDGRERGEWETRYPKRAWRFIIGEATYLAVVFVGSALCILFLALDLPRDWGWASQDQWPYIQPFTLAVFGGSLGGTLFSTKWLYHSVAKGVWNEDRRLWRLFTPVLAGGAALTVVVLSAGGVIPLFGQEIPRSPTGALGVSLLIGYFSDRAFSMLERMAVHQFGLPRGHQHKE